MSGMCPHPQALNACEESSKCVKLERFCGGRKVTVHRLPRVWTAPWNRCACCGCGEPGWAFVRDRKRAVASPGKARERLLLKGLKQVQVRGNRADSTSCNYRSSTVGRFWRGGGDRFGQVAGSMDLVRITAEISAENWVGGVRARRQANFRHRNRWRPLGKRFSGLGSK